MTVHMFRCYIGRGPMSVSDLETTELDGGGETYYAIDVRFREDDPKANLLQKFEDKLKEKVAWYRVGFHSCTHRDGDGSSAPCSWEDTVEWTAKDVSIPNGVPEF